MMNGSRLKRLPTPPDSMKEPLIPALLFVAVTPVAYAQGSLTPPPGTPAPAMRSLQEIWDKIDALQAEVQSLKELNELRQRYNQDFYIHYSNGGSLPWQSGIVIGGPGNEGVSTSLAFGPDGQPAISYYDDANDDLKFARMGLYSPTP